MDITFNITPKKFNIKLRSATWLGFDRVDNIHTQFLLNVPNRLENRYRFRKEGFNN